MTKLKLTFVLLVLFPSYDGFSGRSLSFSPPRLLLHFDLSFDFIFFTLWFYHFISFSFSPFALLLCSTRYLVSTTKSPKESPNAVDGSEKPKKTLESEFISDKFKATDEHDLMEIEENMTRLGMSTTSKVDELKTATPTGKKVTWFWGACRHQFNWIMKFSLLLIWFSLYLLSSWLKSYALNEDEIFSSRKLKHFRSSSDFVLRDSRSLLCSWCAPIDFNLFIRVKIWKKKSWRWGIDDKAAAVCCRFVVWKLSHTHTRKFPFRSTTQKKQKIVMEKVFSSRSSVC